MKFCSNCGKEIPEGTKFCPGCGKKIEQTTAGVISGQGAEARPAQQSYEPPIQQNDFSAGGGNNIPPVPPQRNRGKSGKRPLWIGICVALVLAIAIGAVFLIRDGGNKEKAREPYIGRYEGIGCVMDGEELEADGEWIELKKKGEARMFLAGEEYRAKWEMDGRKITIFYDKDETYQGKIKNGIFTLDLDRDLQYTFQLEDHRRETQEPDETEKAETPIAGYWDGLRVDSQIPENTMEEEDLQSMKEMGMQIYILMDEDGTGYLSLAYPEPITWTEETITVAAYGETCTFKVEEDLLKLYVDTETFVFVRGEGEPPVPTMPQIPDVTETEPTEPETTAEPTADYSWWEGDWYGWWVISDASESLAEMKNSCWDCCGHITVDGDQGSLYLFDEDNEPGVAFCEAEVFFGEGWTENGTMFSRSGNAAGGEIGYLEWSVDPGNNCMSYFGNVIVIEGRTTDPSDDSNWMEYAVYLRPWGTGWEDVQHMDIMDAPYDDMMPPRYFEWYLPAIQAGEEMPDSIPAPE